MRASLTRIALVGALLAGFAAGPLGAAAAAPAEQGRGHGDRARAEARAEATYRALTEYFDPGDGSDLLLERYPKNPEDRPYSYEWPYSQAHIAALDLTVADRRWERELEKRSRGQETYWNAGGGTTGLPGYDSYPRAPFGDGGDMFYDDNQWVGLAKVQRYLQTGDRDALKRAEEVFDLSVSGWDTDPSHPCPGGVYWTQADWSRDRNTVSTMPAAELGLRLYLITRQERYLDWSKKFYDWTNGCLQTDSGLYWDHIDLEGTINKVIWSYNQGVPVGVNVLLYKATKDRKYLDEAKRVAKAAYTHYVTEGRLADQPVFFNSIFFKNLLLLESVTGGSTYHRAMADYADTLWKDKRDPETDLVEFNEDGTTEVIQQAATAQIHAVLAWPRSKWWMLY